MRGNILANLVTQIYDEVFELVKVFADCKYDPLDPEDSVSRRLGRSNETPSEWEAHGGGVCGGESQHFFKDVTKTLLTEQSPDGA